MEKLELHMVMGCVHQLYCQEDGELRSLPSCPHSHLSLVDITGFFGEGDQLELALHILRDATVLRAMKIDPRLKIVDSASARIDVERPVADGYSVALEFQRLRVQGEHAVPYVYIQAARTFASVISSVPLSGTGEVL